MKYLLDYLNTREPPAKKPVSPVSNKQRGDFVNSLIRLMNIKSDILEECCASHSEITLLYFALERFAECGEHITAAQAAELLRVSAPSISRTLKNLEEKGFIERDTDKNDRRSVRIIVTKEGERRVRGVLERIFVIMDRALGEFSNEELIAMAALHSKFVDTIEKAATENSINERGNENA